VFWSFSQEMLIKIRESPILKKLVLNVKFWKTCKLSAKCSVVVELGVKYRNSQIWEVVICVSPWGYLYRYKSELAYEIINGWMVALQHIIRNARISILTCTIAYHAQMINLEMQRLANYTQLLHIPCLESGPGIEDFRCKQ
jgi:hypothetical protein